MLNASGIDMTNERRPSRIPVRGSLALAVTIGGLAMLMGFRTQDDAAGVALALEPTVETGQTVAPAAPAPASAIASSPSASASRTAEASASPSPAVTASPTASPTAEATPGTQTATGNAYQFRFGIVQVAVTVEGDRIVDVQALQMPDGDRHSASISRQVEPMVRQSALAANSATIDVVSGATYTSTAYAYSLQSALDQLAVG
jgi:uncharacterized protein with FMN-binding domain